MAHQFEVVVRSTDVDMLGHVNNAKYLEYMEWARFDWIIQAGLTWEELRRRQILPVVASIQINYRKELRMLDKVTILSKPVRIGGKSFVLRQEIYKESGELACDADFTMVMIDAAARKATVLPEDLVAALREGQEHPAP